MRACRAAILGALIAPAAVAGSAGLNIDLTFGTGFNDATRQNVAMAAAQYWESVILEDFTVAVTCNFVPASTSWGAGNVGRMHSNMQMLNPHPVTNTRLSTGGTAELDADDSWFWDPTPMDNSEYNMNMANGAFGNATDAAAQGRWDALSVLIHEIGHVLGYSGSTGMWGDNQPFTAFTDFANNFTGNTYTFDWLTTGVEGNVGGMNGALGTVRFGPGNFHIDGSGDQAALVTKNMADPGFVAGQRSLLTPLDYEIWGDAFHARVVPEPAGLALLMIGGLIIASRRGR